MGIESKALLITILFIVGSAVFEQLVSGDGIAWFLALKKPVILVPLNLFYVVAGLCSLMWGVVLYRHLVNYLNTHSSQAKFGIILIVSVVLTNSIWNYFFMGLESTRNGFVGMLLFLPVTLIALLGFQKSDELSFWLFLVYVLWVIYDIIWTYQLWELNP